MDVSGDQNSAISDFSASLEDIPDALLLDNNCNTGEEEISWSQLEAEHLETLRDTPEEIFWESLASVDIEAVLKGLEDEEAEHNRHFHGEEHVSGGGNNLPSFPLVLDAPMPIDENIAEEEETCVLLQEASKLMETAFPFGMEDLTDGRYCQHLGGEQGSYDEYSLEAVGPMAIQIADFDEGILDNLVKAEEHQQEDHDAKTKLDSYDETSFDSGIEEDRHSTSSQPDKRDNSLDHCINSFVDEEE